MADAQGYTFRLLEPDDDSGVAKVSKRIYQRLALGDEGKATVKCGEKDILLPFRGEQGIRDNRIRLDRKAMESLSAHEGEAVHVVLPEKDGETKLPLEGDEDALEVGIEEVKPANEKKVQEQPKSTKKETSLGERQSQAKSLYTEDEQREAISSILGRETSLFNGLDDSAEKLISEATQVDRDDSALEERLKSRVGKIMDWMKELDSEYRTREQEMLKKVELTLRKREDERVHAIEEEFRRREQKKEEELRAEMERKEEELEKRFEEKLKELEADKIQKVALEHKLELGKRLKTHTDELYKKEDELRRKYEEEFRKKLTEMESRLKAELKELEEEKLHMLEFDHKRKLREKEKELEEALSKREEELRKKLDEDFKKRFEETLKRLEAEAREREDTRAKMLELEFKKKYDGKVRTND